MSSYIDELRDVIRRLHGVESEHLKSVPVKETFRGETVWEGLVEVFYLTGHPKAAIAYAWSHDTGDPDHPKRPSPCYIFRLSYRQRWQYGQQLLRS